MSARRFTQVDVFTDTPLLGNPLAVVHDAQGLTEAQIVKLLAPVVDRLCDGGADAAAFCKLYGLQSVLAYGQHTQTSAATPPVQEPVGAGV